MMTKQGRILIVDDLAEWCEALVEILQSAGYYAKAVNSIAEALEQLHTHLYHVVVLDIRMDGANQNNVEGIHLLQELAKEGLNEATQVVMLSAYGTKEQMRSAFRDYDVADFITKDLHFNSENLLENIQLVFAQKVKMNLALDILWDPKNTLEEAIFRLEMNGVSLRRSSTVQRKRWAEELEDLLYRLFYQAENVLIRPLTPGYSGTGVVRALPFYAPIGSGREVVVKFGDVHKIEREYRNFKQYVQPFVGSGRNTTALDDLRRTPHFGGIVYSLLGADTEQLMNFSDFYRQKDIQQIKTALNMLFFDTCSIWYANCGVLQRLDLAEDYQRLFRYTTRELEQILFKQLKSVHGKDKLFFDTLKSERAFTNPLLATAHISHVYPTYICTTHGDFNQHNLLIDAAGHTWLIDFQETEQGHILRDVAVLDSAVRFQLISTEEAPLEDRLHLEEALCNIEHFSEVDQLQTLPSTINPSLTKAYSTVAHLRTIAQQLMQRNPKAEIREYYIALLYTALNTLRFSSLSVTQREHALLCASLLTDRLGLGT